MKNIKEQVLSTLELSTEIYNEFFNVSENTGILESYIEECSIMEIAKFIQAQIQLNTIIESSKINEKLTEIMNKKSYVSRKCNKCEKTTIVSPNLNSFVCAHCNEITDLK